MNTQKYREMIVETTEEPNNMSDDWKKLMGDFACLLNERAEKEMDNEVFQVALQKWGGEHQKLKLFCEMAELVVAICHTDEGKCEKWDIAGEIADVQNLLEQMIILYGIRGETNRQHKEKMEKLKGLIKGDNNG